ncbi:MAG: cob(I)yrinic acid a,c-diamide adenosyltransferase [Rhodospirillales bacterium]|nr:cob(I)yrinic acid a,c-diamide adenosyltransferase [Rhodospirillales bacterium]
MVRLTKIYTRGGDDGSTSLGDGNRVSKASPRVAAYGAVDEANASLGLACLHADERYAKILARIQNDLFDLGADLCVPPSRSGKERIRVESAQVEWLERMIDALNADLPPLDSFVLPGGSAAAAYLHVARTIVRRAERLVVELNLESDLPEAEEGTVGPAVTPAALTYLNRLSDLLFVLARHANDAGRTDMLWRPRAYASNN